MTTDNVFLNDIHAGSNWAIGPKQQELVEFFNKLAKKWRNPDKLILNGDLIDGLAFRANLAECWTTDLQEQADYAIGLIKQLNAKQIYVIRGTPYHTQTKGFDAEEYIAKELGAVKERVQDKDQYSTLMKLINLAPKGAPERIVHVAHHLAGSKWFMYRGTAISREMTAAMLNESHWIDKHVHEKIWGVVRAHNHYFWWEESASRAMLCCPAWQLSTPFMMKVMPASPPDIGAVRICVENDGYAYQQHELARPMESMPKVWA